MENNCCELCLEAKRAGTEAFLQCKNVACPCHIKLVNTPKLDWRERFRKEFVATGADIEGMKRVEYRQFRELQVEQIISFIAEVEKLAEERGRKDAQSVRGYQMGHEHGRNELKAELVEKIEANLITAQPLPSAGVAFNDGLLLSTSIIKSA